jgi:penicillin-binding protein 1A
MPVARQSRPDTPRRKAAAAPRTGAAASGARKPAGQTRSPAARGSGPASTSARATRPSPPSQQRTRSPQPGKTTQRRRPPRRAQPRTRVAQVIVWILRRWWLWAAAGFAAGAVAVFALLIGNVPLPAALPAAQSSTVLSADGSVLALYHGTEDRVIVPLSQISMNLRQAVVAAEDRNFFSNSGVSLRGTLRALWVDVAGGQIAQGGSTITQQYVRNALPGVGRQRSIVRKLREATLAIKFERKYSKDKILEDYLNTVYFGRGAYGAEAAARAYFNKPAKDLSVAQASYLAGIIRRPEYYQPDSNPQGATQIRDTVLADMVSAGYLSPRQADSARAQKLSFQTGSASSSARGAYFVEYVRRLLKDTYHLSDQQILTGGLRISTTLDLRLQDAAEAAVSSTLDKADDPQAALVAMETDGSIRAMVGGRDTSSLQAAQGFNYAAQKSGANGGRQPGSAFKPFTLADFIESGYSVDSTFQGPPAVVVTSRQCQNLDGSNWSVNNFKNESYGDLTVTEATAQSVNTVYAQLVDRLRPANVRSLAERVGGWTNLSPVCSIALGTSAVTPLEMARAYATFAARGQRPDPLAVTKVVTADGRVLVDQAPRAEHVLDPNVADTVTQVLTQVLDHGTAKGKGIGRPAAGKTGTTEKLTDAWFVGYTPTLSAAVWMGYPFDAKANTTPPMTNVHGIEVSGGTLPATIWQKFMKSAVAPFKVATFTAPTAQGKVIGPSGAPCASGVQPTPDNPCTPPGSPCPATPTATATAAPTTAPAAAGATQTATPAPCPSEALPPDIVIPSPSPSTSASPGASPGH